VFDVPFSKPELLPIQWGVVIGASLVAALTDVHRRQIPNLLTFPLLACGLLTSFALRGPIGLADGLAACVILALPYVYLFVFANGGAGDAKLMAALGAWLGVFNGLVVLASVALAGVVLAIGWTLIHRRKPVSIPAMPYGVAISIGVCCAATGLWLMRLS